MRSDRITCDGCSVDKRYYTHWFIFARSYEDVVSELERCITACSNAYDDLIDKNMSLAGDYYGKMEDIKDIRNSYERENEEKKEKAQMAQRVKKAQQVQQDIVEAPQLPIN